MVAPWRQALVGIDVSLFSIHSDSVKKYTAGTGLLFPEKYSVFIVSQATGDHLLRSLISSNLSSSK